MPTVIYIQNPTIVPTSDTMSNVTFKYVIAGTLPDIVQVYVGNANTPNSVGNLVDVIPTTAGETSYASKNPVSLSRGVLYQLSLCPRNMSGDQPDDQYDGDYWGHSCSRVNFAVPAAPSPSVPAGGDSSYPKPAIVSVQGFPATMKDCNYFLVKWTSSRAYDKYIIWWTQNGVPHQQGEVVLGYPTTTGQWGTPSTDPCVPGDRYSFQVEGGVNQFWNYKYSGWGPTVTRAAVANLSSLRAYLMASGVPNSNRLDIAQDIGNLMKNATVPTTSLRAFMKL